MKYHSAQKKMQALRSTKANSSETKGTGYVCSWTAEQNVGEDNWVIIIKTVIEVGIHPQEHKHNHKTRTAHENKEDEPHGEKEEGKGKCELEIEVEMKPETYTKVARGSLTIWRKTYVMVRGRNSSRFVLLLEPVA